jgi:hypothetical protein
MISFKPLHLMKNWQQRLLITLIEGKTAVLVRGKAFQHGEMSWCKSFMRTQFKQNIIPHGAYAALKVNFAVFWWGNFVMPKLIVDDIFLDLFAKI